MGKHKVQDKKANLLARALLKKGDLVGAAQVLKTTSKENQQGFIKRVKQQ